MVENCSKVFLAAMFSILVSCASTGGDRLQGELEQDYRIANESNPERSVQSELLYQVLVGEFAGHVGAVEEAVDHYSQAARLSNDPAIAERATRIALYAGDFEHALASAKRWVEFSPESLEARQILAILYVRSGQPDKAIPHFDQVVSTAAPHNNAGFMLIGAILARESDEVQALKAMQLLVEKHPKDARAHSALAKLALDDLHYQLAVEASGKALYLDPNLAEARNIRAQAYMRLGQSERALRDMSSAVKADPKNYKLHLAYARMLVQAQRYEAARVEFNQLIKERPRDENLIYTVGLLDLQEHKYEEAIENFNQLIKSGKRVDEGYYYLGRVAEERKQYKQAMGWYGKIKDGDYLVDGQVRVAEILVKLGSIDKAMDHFKKVRSTSRGDEDSVKLYLAEGQLLREAGRYHTGMQVYNRALTEHPGNGDLLYARALMAEKIDRIDLLEADLHAILAQDPDNATALNALGYTLANRNERIAEAFKYIRHALEMRPDDPTVIDSMGWVQFRMGNYAAAEQYLRRAFTLLQDAEIAGHLSEAIWSRGKKTEAIDVLHRALKIDPHHEYLLKLQQKFNE